MELPPEIMGELEFLAMEAQRGAPLSAHLTKGLERDITALFRRMGRDDVSVRAVIEGGGVVVHLLIPAPRRRVERVSLRLF